MAKSLIITTLHITCYVQVEHSAQLERGGCDQDVSLSGDRASALGTQ